MVKENNWDKLLQINTIGRDETNADEYRHGKAFEGLLKRYFG